MKDNGIQDGVRNVNLSSWREFGEFIQNEHAGHTAFMYRGQDHVEWLIESRFDRLEKEFPKKRNYSAGIPDYFDCPPVSREQQFRAFQEAARGKLGANLPDLKIDEWWAVARHHGLATPLLDWTYSPYVALYFAFESKRCIVENNLIEPKVRAVLAVAWHLISDGARPDSMTPLRQEKGTVPKVYTPLRDTARRISAQQGVFMLMPAGSDLEAHVPTRFKGETNRAVLTKIAIPNDGRTECLKQLNKMNINRMTLFPDLDGAAEHINALWELDFDSGLGTLPENTNYDKPG